MRFYFIITAMNFLKKIFGQPDIELVEGGVYITKREGKSYPYTACKILHVDDAIVSIMMYRNCFKEFPTDLDISTLTIAMPTEKEELDRMLSGDSDMRMGVGCVPIDRQGFIAGNPVLIAKTELQDWERGFYESMLKSMNQD